MAKKKNPLVFMDLSIDGDPSERMVFELFLDVAPKTAENFLALCTGEKGVSPISGKPLHYKGSFFHRIIKGSMAQGGDFLRRDGTCGESIYGEQFPDESPKLKHDGAGLLSMSVADRDTLGSHFNVTFKPNHHLDRKHVVFGKLLQGEEVLKKIEYLPVEDEKPAVTVKIINCGEYNEDILEDKKLKTGKVALHDTYSVDSRRKGKHKKSSKDRRKKRRRYYSSDSESSSDSETESSESDSDSDSSLSSSSDLSSSSEDRRKKRKRSSKRDKYKRSKRRDKRREKRRKRRDKRSKHKSKRASGSPQDGESESKYSADDGVRNQNLESSQKAVADQSPFIVEREDPSLNNDKREERNILKKDEGESPRENGGQRSNGVEEAKPDGCTDRQPDVVDDHPGKSRSGSMSPKRAMNKSISPRKSPSINRWQRSRSISRSPVRSARNRSPASSASRSPVKSVSRSPQRSISRSPVSISRSPVRARPRRTISRSPLRVLSGRSLSRSPPRTSSRKSISRSPLRSSRRSISRSPIKSSRRSISRSSGRAPRRNVSRSPIRSPRRSGRRSYSRSLTPVRRPRSPSDRGRSISRSVSPDGSPKRIRRGRGFSQRYSYARRYRTPSPDRSPVRSYRYSGRTDRDRYSSYRRYSPRRYRSPRGRTPPLRYRGRRSRTRSPSVSRSPRYRGRRYSRSPSPVGVRSHASRDARQRSASQSRSQSRSPSVSRSALDSESPKQPTTRARSLSRSSSGSLDGNKGLVSYDDGSPDSGRC